MGLEEALEEPGFYILGGGALVAEAIGFIIAKKSNLAMLPWWQMLILMAVTLLAAAYFTTKE